MATGAKFFETLKVLIIEDKDHMRALLRRLLNHIGVRVMYEAPDGAAALEMLPTIECDLILSDLSMAPMDGLEFARKVRGASNPKAAGVPIIMISGYAEKAKVEAARDAGVSEFLVKPVTPQHLISRITEIWERPRAFVKTETYAGPDRRRRQSGNYAGPGRRADDPPGTKGFLEPPKPPQVIEAVKPTEKV
ncbi:MAG TPA: response regulator [Rhizomicrobium sp.]|nr:response regulator [Rhizomicrobium sp.]